MTTERLSILAAAVALGEFTAPQLAAYTGANPNTVRQVLRREQESRGLFEHSGPDQHPGPGRASLWRIKDPSVVLDEIASEESKIVGLRSAGQGARDRSAALSWLHRMDTLLLSAEDAAAQSYDVEDSVEQKAFAQIAINLLQAANPDTGGKKTPRSHWWEHPPADLEEQSPRVIGVAEGRTDDAFDSAPQLFVLDSDLIYQRARSIAAFAYLAARRAEGLSVGTKHLLPVAEAIAAGSRFLPPQVTESWLRRIVGISLDQRRHPPPIAVLTQHERSPDDLFPVIRGQWRCIGSPPAIARANYAVWVEDWAEPLFSASLMPGVVVSHEDTPEANSVLNQVLAENEQSQYAQATIVASSTDDLGIVARVSGGGGTFYPIREAREGLLQAVSHAVMQAVRLTYGPLTARFADASSVTRQSIYVARRGGLLAPHGRALNLLMRLADIYWPQESRSTTEHCINIFHQLIEEKRPELFANVGGVGSVTEEIVQYSARGGLRNIKVVEVPQVNKTYWNRRFLQLEEQRHSASTLTDVEDQIVHLVARGMSNQTIADALNISQASTARHIAAVREKLSLTSRAEIASWVDRRDEAAG